MAPATLAVLTHPEFPQVFSALIDREILYVNRIVDESHLFPCCYESPESAKGLCDGGEPCVQPGVVHDLVSQQPYCALHFYRTQLRDELRRLEEGR